MSPLVIGLAVAVSSQTPIPEPEHAANPILARLVGEGVKLGGTDVRLPAPILRDGQSAEAQREALRTLAGSEAAAEGLLRPSVSAPHVLKIRDVATGGDTLVRAAGLWFVVHADLDRLDAADVRRRIAEAKPVEAGNMRFESKLLGDEELKSIKLTAPEGDRAWATRMTGRLLDRIGFETIDETVASRSGESVVFASRTVPAADDRNRWWPIRRRGSREEAGESEPYPGGVGYVKVSRLKLGKDVLLVEVQFAFAEPRAWFDGAPILRSKIGLAAQDQIRDLRRELAKERSK